jgi:hypothetical protein
MSTESTIDYTFEKEDGTETELELTFTISDYDPGVSSGPVERCYPPEGGEVEVTGCEPECPEFWEKFERYTDFRKDIEDRCAEKGMEIQRHLESHHWDENL